MKETKVKILAFKVFLNPSLNRNQSSVLRNSNSSIMDGNGSMSSLCDNDRDHDRGQARPEETCTMLHLRT